MYNGNIKFLPPLNLDWRETSHCPPVPAPLPNNNYIIILAIQLHNDVMETNLYIMITIMFYDTKEHREDIGNIILFRNNSYSTGIRLRN